MKQKNILITGASQGIGKAIAKHLSLLGANLVLVARNEEKLEALKAELDTSVYVFSYDLRELDKIGEIFEYCKAKGIKLDGMVHCAGVNRDVPIRSNDIAMMQETMTVNYMSFAELSKYFIKKKYSNDGAAIVAISSGATSFIAAGMSTYTSSKAALEATVKVMAKEVTKRNMRVNAIAPACVRTEMVDEAPFLQEEEINQRQPFGLIEPEYIAKASAFLLSDDAKYITGAVLPVMAGQV